jgi:hypothetical protein
VDSNSIHGPSAENRWHSTRNFWKSALFRRLRPTPILVDHGTGGTGKIIFLAFYAYADRQIEVECILYVNLKARWSWTSSCTRSQTPGIRIGLDLHLVVHVFLNLRHLLDVSHVLHDPLIDS